ncbi:MAG: class I SAM-dependent methyltransferase [Candidatus Heimdallarchaeaceae archaeon]
MSNKKEESNQHFSLFSHALSRLVDPPLRFVKPYIKAGQVVADLGSGPGYFALYMAKILGPKGKVFAVDSDERTIKALKKKAVKEDIHNIEAHATSSSNLSFIKDGSVDFVLANGLLCCVAPQEHEAVVNEIERILKPTGLAFLSIAKRYGDYMSKEEWENILKRFNVIKRKNIRLYRSAEVSLKSE